MRVCERVFDFNTFSIMPARIVSFYLLFDYSRGVLCRHLRVLTLYPFPIILCTFYAVFISEFSRFTLLNNFDVYL